MKYEQNSVDISLVLSVLLLESHTGIMLNICQLLNLTTQLQYTSFGQPDYQAIVNFAQSVV